MNIFNTCNCNDPRVDFISSFWGYVVKQLTPPPKKKWIRKTCFLIQFILLHSEA